MNKQITWGSKLGFGKYKDLSLITIKIKDPKYLKWCYENELHLKYETLNFVFENISTKELEDMLR